jgi:cytidine deaminase
MEKEQLIELAKKAREMSYSPYSHFAVGAALLCKDGSVYQGANVENASYPLCMCAERNALYNAYMHGKTKEDFVAFALIADTDEPCSPCGACRQVISELYPANAPIYMSNMHGKIKETNAVELLPFAFNKEDL